MISNDEVVALIRGKHASSDLESRLKFIVEYMRNKGISLSQLTQYIESEPLSDTERIQLHRRRLANTRSTRERFAIGKEKAKLRQQSS